MSILKTLKETFAPSPEVGAQRRLKAFGSTSKTKAAAVIGATAALAIAAPVVVSRVAGTSAARAATAEVARDIGGTLTKIPGNVVRYATSSPLNAVKTLAGAGFIAGGGLALAPKVFEGTKAATQVAVPIITGDVPFKKENLTDIGEAIGAGLGGAAIGAALGAGASYLLSDSPKSKGFSSSVLNLPSAGGGTGSIAASPTPITPATTTQSTSIARRKKKTKAPQQIVQRVNVNVINNSRLQKYIKTSYS